MQKLLFIMLGGALGSAARYYVSDFVQNKFQLIFPFGTLAVNVIGSFIIGFMWGLFDQTMLSTNMRFLIFTGILGGFTTFSTFAIETFTLLQDGEYKFAILSFLGNNVLGILFAFLGFILFKWIFRLIV
ncbi:MAG: chromosome condensation protein CrcB [Ignavibacteria bacterium GWF2_33_9]|nr:MAG: chromosome condensation protein CrcB [Ignavibacteria bacterium GWF2_33_9]